jgi:Domain of unknown function (DUF1905)
MAPPRYSFVAELWEHDGAAAWHFVSLPEAEADEIEAMYRHEQGGFGSVRVDAMIGATRWSTSIFPDRKRGTYLLPVKKAVRLAERLVAGSTAQVDLVVIP